MSKQDKIANKIVEKLEAKTTALGYDITRSDVEWCIKSTITHLNSLIDNSQFDDLDEYQDLHKELKDTEEIQELIKQYIKADKVKTTSVDQEIMTNYALNTTYNTLLTY